MDRRFFLKSVLTLAGAGAATALLAPEAQALPLLEELQAMEATGSNPLVVGESDLPAQGASEAQYYYGQQPRRHRRRARRYYRPLPPPRVRRCRTFYDRWGRLVRRCWWG
jgi:hypothetical protein